MKQRYYNSNSYSIVLAFFIVLLFFASRSAIRYFDDLKLQREAKQRVEKMFAEIEERENPKLKVEKTIDDIKYNIGLRIAKERKNAGVNELLIVKDLNNSAQMKADYLVETDTFEHDDETHPSIKWTFQEYYENIYGKEGNMRMGEILVRGFYGSEDAVKAYMDSPAHKELMLRNGWVHMGIGLATYKNGWMVCVVHFAKVED